MHEKGLPEKHKPTRHHSYNGGYVDQVGVGVCGVPNGKKCSRQKRPKCLVKSKSSGQLPVHIMAGGEQICDLNPTPVVEDGNLFFLHSSGSSGSFPLSLDDNTLVGTTSSIVNGIQIDECVSGILQNTNEGTKTWGSFVKSDSDISVKNSPDLESQGSTIVSFLEDQNNRYNDLVSKNRILQENDRQSLKHLSASAPAMRTDLGKLEKGEFFMAPSSSKSRQKKFHRHFKTVPVDEKVLDYYSCALVGDILLQGFLYISENYFAFYSNVFGYVTKLLIPITTVVSITKERTAKIFPNAVGIQTQSEKHVFASLISRDTTHKLMYKVWMHKTKQLPSDTLIIPKDSHNGYDDTSGDIAIADDSTGDSGSGNDSALEPSSCSPSPQSTPGVDKPLNLHGRSPISNNNVIIHKFSNRSTAQLGNANLPPGTFKMLANGSSPVYLTNSRAGTSFVLGANADQNFATSARKPQQIASNFIPGSGLGGPTKLSSLMIVATILLVILFISAALLIFRISNLQQKLTERPTSSNSEQFYQDLLNWQNHLHSSSADEIHQFIDTNLQQIVKVRESLEALSTLFLHGQHNSVMGEGSSHSQLGRRDS